MYSTNFPSLLFCFISYLNEKENNNDSCVANFLSWLCFDCEPVAELMRWVNVSTFAYCVWYKALSDFLSLLSSSPPPLLLSFLCPPPLWLCGYVNIGHNMCIFCQLNSHRQQTVNNCDHDDEKLFCKNVGRLQKREWEPALEWHTRPQTFHRKRLHTHNCIRLKKKRESDWGTEVW